MKKVFVTFIALLAISASVMADGHVDSVRYLTTRWGKNWYVSAGATANWWQGSMNVPETFTNTYNKVEWGHPHFGFTVNFGKWINHKTAVRLYYNNTKINSYILGRHIGLTSLQYLYGDNPEIVETVGGQSIYRTSMRYHNLEAQYMVSPIDFFQGYYNPDRIWTPILYASMGAGLNSNDLFVTQSLIHYANYKKNKNMQYNGTTFELALGAGLLNNFRISEHFDIFLDINWTFQRWTIDTWTYEFGGNVFCTSLEEIRPKRFDNMYTAALGLTYYFSRVYDLCESDTIREADTIFIEKGDGPCDTIVKFVNMQTEDILSYPFSIFFHRDSYQLMSRRDIVNLREIANVAKENGYKLRLTGSCDSATATPAYNQTLSENRCNKIKYELMQLGIPEDQIILEPIGGVKILDPTE